jgi:hypothetical protein
MHSNTIMSQLLVHIPRHQFDTLVSNLGGDRYVKAFTTWSQLATLFYAQASGKNSLRDIQNALALQAGKLYHLGLPDRICRSTLADANAKRDWRIFESLFYRLLARCRDVTPRHQFRFKNPLYSLDSTVIDLCLSMFPWAKFCTTKGALKLHYQFDHAGQIPSFLTVTDAKSSDIAVMEKNLPLIPDSIYCQDRGYVDFQWFRRIAHAGAFFVTRLPENIRYRFTGQHPQDKKRGVLLDATIQLTGRFTSHYYPAPLRLVRYHDPDSHRTFDFLTNQFTLTALTIAQIYKARWQIEAFFKWIKQNLKIKTFLGTSKNAVLSQIWVAMCYYLLLAYIKYQSRYRYSLFYLHRMVSETLLERLSLIDLLSLTHVRLHKLKFEPQLCLAL